MKTLKKISLKSASVLDDKQLKQIYGGSGAPMGVNCGLFDNEDKCAGICYERLSTVIKQGLCDWRNTLLKKGENGQPDTYKYMCVCAFD